MLRATIKSLLGHKLRLLLTTLAVTLGVSFVVGSFVFTDTLGAVFDNLFSQTTSTADVIIRPAGDFNAFGPQARPVGVPPALIDEITNVDGVEQVEGSVFGVVQILGADGTLLGTGPPIIATSWAETGLFTIAEGRPPRSDGEIVLSEALVDQQGFTVGGPVTVIAAGFPETFTLVGTATLGTLGSMNGVGFAIFETTTAQRVLGIGDRFDTIQVAAAPGVSPEQLVERIQPLLPDGFEAQSAQTVAEEQANQVKEGLGFFNTFLLVFAGVALFVGTFIIQNTFRILIAQRTRELGLLRALGATSRQVTLMMLGEAFVVGLVASVLGLGGGIGLAYLVRLAFEAFGGQIPDEPLLILGRTVAAAFAIGVTVTVVAALLPARRAARIPPMAALREEEGRMIGQTRRSRILIGSVLTVLGVVALLLGLNDLVPEAVTVVGIGAGLMFIGIAALAPTFARPVASILGRPIALITATSGELARRNAMRTPRRTATTASALMIGLALVSLVAILAASLQATVDDLIGETFTADLELDSLSLQGTGFSPDITDEVAALPVVGELTRIRSATAEIDDDATSVSGIEPDKYASFINLNVVEGSIEALDGDGVALDADYAERHDFSVGDPIEIRFPDKTVTLTVRAIFTENRTGGRILIPMSAFVSAVPQQLDVRVLLRFAPGVDPEAGRSAIEAVVADYPNVALRDEADLRAEATSQINTLLSLIFALLALAVIIALLGITNTLSLSVIERTREIGLLRAVGMTRRQVRDMIRSEAMIIALFGAVLGIVVGVFFGWATVQAISSDTEIHLAIPVGYLLAGAAGAGIAGVFAAVIPARRAGRLNVLEAIAYE